MANKKKGRDRTTQGKMSTNPKRVDEIEHKKKKQKDVELPKAKDKKQR